MLAGGAQNATPLLRCFDPHVLSNYRYVTYAFELGRLALPVGEGLAEMTRSHIRPKQASTTQWLHAFYLANSNPSMIVFMSNVCTNARKLGLQSCNRAQKTIAAVQCTDKASHTLKTKRAKEANSPHVVSAKTMCVPQC